MAVKEPVDQEMERTSNFIKSLYGDLLLMDFKRGFMEYHQDIKSSFKPPLTEKELKLKLCGYVDGFIAGVKLTDSILIDIIKREFPGIYSTLNLKYMRYESKTMR